MNAVIYARYSSHSQQETSIEGQLKVCYEYCEKQGYTVVNEYIDRAMSGRDDNRPSFLRMISDSSKKGFQYVVVYQFDRFSRNRFSSAKYKELLKSNGVRVLSAKETVSDQPDGILVEGFFECMAEYYSAELSQKVKRGMDINAEKCLSTGGNIALGYKIDREKRFQIDNDKAPIVKKVFEMYADGISISEIVDYLNRLGYTTAKGKEFKKNSLQTMLRNKRYTGVYTYKGTEIPDGIPRIISDELFEKVAKRLAKNKQAPTRSKAKEDYLLTTKLFCGYCKEMMTGISGKGHLGSVYRYYTCNGKRKHGCNKKSVRKEYIENIVVKQCKKLLTDRNIKKIAKAVSELCVSQQESYHLQDLKSQLSKAIRKHDNLLEVLSECEDKEIRQSVLGKLSQINEQIKSLNSEILKEEKSINIVSEDDVLFFLLSLKNNRNNDEKYRKTLINIFVNAVYLYDDKLTIIFNSGDKPVTVNDLLLEEIQENLESYEGLCFNSVGPPTKRSTFKRECFFLFYLCLVCITVLWYTLYIVYLNYTEVLLMADIKAFRGMRFDTEKAGKIESLCCPPYDIISEEERLGFIAENENNIIRLELPKGDTPYKDAAEVLKDWEDRGVLIREDKPAIYIYEEEFTAYGKSGAVKGIIVRLKVEEFEKGVVLPHEFTLSKAKEDRLNLMKATNCNFSQIYGLYMDEEHTSLSTIDEASKVKPDFEFTDKGEVTHRLWIITDEEVINKLVDDFKDRKIYIADGHHRYETALNYRNYCRENGISKEGDAQDFQMIYLVDMEHPGLVVFPTHRLVRDLEEFDSDEVLCKCSKYFDIEAYTSADNMEAELEAEDKLGKKAFGFYVGEGEWYKLTLKDIAVMDELLPEMSAVSRALDVTVLHTLVLEKIFGIDKENMAAQINLTYTKFFEEAISFVDEGKAQCSFVLNPTKVKEIRDVASQGEKMPQKSTYFYPKMITGLVMNKLED